MGADSRKVRNPYMALSITELELESTDYLPAREVMTTFGRAHDPEQEIEKDDGHVSDAQDGNEYEGGLLNGVNIQDVLTDINVEEVQVGLINVLVEDLQDVIDVGTANDDESAIVEE
jgi:hypothetical protein